MTSLAEQQSLLRAAIAAMEDRPTPPRGTAAVTYDATLTGLRYALADHDDPDTGCLADPGSECLAVTRARAILAGAS